MVSSCRKPYWRSLELFLFRSKVRSHWARVLWLRLENSYRSTKSVDQQAVQIIQPQSQGALKCPNLNECIGLKATQILQSQHRVLLKRPIVKFGVISLYLDPVLESHMQTWVPTPIVANIFFLSQEIRYVPKHI